MKYIKLFESFESSKINKTLSFLNKDGKSKFLDILKKLCGKYDLPESKLNDGLFEYLSYSKAIKFNGDESPLVDCPAECEDGKITIKYGKGTRKVTCNTCKGVGKIEPKSELSLIKFWFSQNGDFLSMTGVDGVYRPLNVSDSGSESKTFSKDLANYDEVNERIPKTRMNELLNTGDIVKLTLINRRWHGPEDIPNVVAFVVRSSNNKLWAIQETHSYHYDYIPTNDYSKYGTHAWQMTSGSIRNIVKLKPKTAEDTDEVNPMGYNTQLDDNFKIQQIAINSKVANANFAIILDLNKLKGIDSKKIDIKTNREENRRGATSLLSNADIKLANIDRYFSEIRKRSEVVGNMNDIHNFNKIISRLSGGAKYSIYNLLYSNGFLIQTPRDISHYILAILKTINKKKETDELDSYLSSDEFKRYITEANSIYKSGMDTMLRYSKTHDNNILNIETQIKEKLGEDAHNRFIELKNLLGKLSTTIYNYISSFNKCECLEDVSILLQELLGLKEILLSNMSRDLNPGNWSSYNYYSNACNNIKIYDDVVDGLNYSISIVNRKIQLNK